MNAITSRIWSSESFTAHAGMSADFPTALPPPLITLNRSESDNLLILALSVQSAGLVFRSLPAGPSHLPPGPWHLAQLALCTSSPAARFPVGVAPAFCGMVKYRPVPRPTKIATTNIFLSMFSFTSMSWFVYWL